jgi:hypothetical protein
VKLIDGLGLDCSADELGQNPRLGVAQVVHFTLIVAEPDWENKVPFLVV